jgi:hypothetical protein
MTPAAIIAMVLIIPALGQAPTPGPVVTSICSIAAHPSKFQSKSVRVRGTAVSGMEASVLIDTKHGEWNKECGQINLDFGSSGRDESTSRFVQFFTEQISVPKCDNDEQTKQGMAHILDPSVPAPTPCFSSICVHCPRYSIAATFTGKLRYSPRARGGFGHLGMFNLQLDVTSVSNLDVTDELAPSKR